MSDHGSRSIVRPLLLTLLGALALGGCGLIALMFYAFGPAMCGTTLDRTVPSPDGQHRAVVFGASCGATDAGEYGLSILNSDEPFTDDTDFNVLRYYAGYPQGLRLEWLSSDTLAVTFNRPWTEYHADDFDPPAQSVGAVHVVYRDTVVVPRENYLR